MLWTVVDLLVRSALVLSLAALLCRIGRGGAARHRHRILLLASVVLLVWPLLPWLLPEVVLPLIHDSGKDALVTVNSTILSQARGRGVVVPYALPVLIWGIGAVGMLLRLVAAHVGVRYVTRNAVPLSGTAYAEAQALAAACDLRQVPRLLLAPDDEVMPHAVGLFRPKVILPRTFPAWPPQRRESVLSHEFAHLQRRDLLSQALFAFTTALWWIQPLCWWAVRQARLESERACDEIVLDRGTQPSAYASTLLWIADRSRLLPSGSVSLPFAGSSSLEQRLTTILASPGDRRATRWSLPIAVLFVLLACACSATTVAAQNFKGGVSMRRTIFASLFPGLLPTASLSAAAIAGSVLDPSGAAILNAKASLYNPETKARAETTSQSDGHFAFDHLSAGQYILRVDKSGFQPILKAFSVAQDTNVDQGLRLRSGSSDAARDPGTPATENRGNAATGAGPIGPVRIGGEVAQSNLIHKVNPIYPPEAKAAAIQGEVALDAVIGADGIPKDVQVASAPSDDLAQSALEAVRQWRYNPVLLNGNPVEVATRISVNYTLLR